MKRILSALIIAILLSSFTGCMEVTGDPNGESKKESQSASVSASESQCESKSESRESVSTPIVNPYESKDSQPDGESESYQDSIPSASESESEGDSESIQESESQPETEGESESEEVLYVVTISYKTSYHGQVKIKTLTVRAGEKVSIDLPSIPEDITGDYAFNGWKIKETGAMYSKDTRFIEIVVNGNITVETVYDKKQYTGNY